MAVSRGIRAVGFRWRRARLRAGHALSARRVGDVMFVCGPAGEARRYRCDHQREQLQLVGERADAGYEEGLRLESLIGRYSTVVLYRVPWSDEVGRLVERARVLGSTVLADVDDLVFDPARVHLISGLERLDDRARSAYQEAVVGLRRNLEAVDGVVTSTEPLHAEVAVLNNRVVTVYNTVGSDMTVWAERAKQSRQSESRTVVGYLSGTPTHDRDFREASDAVLSVLDRNPRVRFHAIGDIELDERFETFGDRVTRSARVQFERLPTILCEIDVNLAPLERNNAFTECKSCIKYLEAALLAVPTVASPRSDFSRVIEHGVNGLLADDPDSWRAALEELITSPSRRTELGQAALEDALTRRTTAASAEATASAFRELTG
jgi:O-antigen biosynthesis protein